MLVEETFIIFKTTAQVTIKIVFCSRYVLYNAIVKKIYFDHFWGIDKITFEMFPI